MKSRPNWSTTKGRRSSVLYDSSTNVGDKLLERDKSICDVESKSLEVATTCSSQTLGLDSLTRTVSIDNVQDLIGKSEDTMNQIAAHAQTCATLRIKIKSLKDEAALAEQVNSNSGKLCECMKSFESSMTRVAVTSITSMLDDLSFD